jgi:hypothetical protein
LQRHWKAAMETGLKSRPISNSFKPVCCKRGGTIENCKRTSTS